MGADLYRKGDEDIRKALDADWEHALADRDKGVAGAQERVEQVDAARFPDTHYFRDSYNAWNMLAKIELSWWADVLPLVNAAEDDDEGYSPVSVSERVLALITEPGRREKLGEIEDAEDRAYFIGRYDRLTAFLELSIAAGDGVSWSL